MKRKCLFAVASVVCGASLLLLGAAGALAATLHEDPNAVTQEFDATALFQYYSYSLDAILVKDSTEAEARLSKAPWANVPETLVTTTGDFASSGIRLIGLVTQVDQDVNRLKMLTTQSRLDEAAVVAVVISGNLTAARSELTLVERAVTDSGREFGVAAAPAGGDLQASYQEVLDRINRIREMLSVFRQLLVTEVEGMRPDQALLSELAKQGIGIDAADLPVDIQPERAEITLSLEPPAAFVGDRISFQGKLTSASGPMAQREVDILLNSWSNVTVTTDAAGHYQGTMIVPYWYQPEIAVQALYYPRTADRGKYLASLSPAVRLQVQYYTFVLKVEPETKAYPGRQAGLRLSIDYGNAPVPTARDVKIYVDGRLVIEAEVPPSGSSLMLDVDQNAAPGSHVLTASAAAVGRYATCSATADLEITRAVPVLEAELPTVIFAPATLNFSGRVVSELGPIDGMPVKLSMGNSEETVTSVAGGVVSARIGLGMSLSIAGWQDFTLRADPTEPWYSPLSVTRRVFVVNVVNSSGLVIALALLGIYLPARLKRRLGSPTRARESPVPQSLSAEAGVNLVTNSREADSATGEPGAQIIYWYRQAANALLKAVSGARKPGQTLREFAIDMQQVLGPAGRYFVQLTRMLERLLYSRHQPTAGDVEETRQLSLSVSERVKK